MWALKIQRQRVWNIYYKKNRVDISDVGIAFDTLSHFVVVTIRYKIDHVVKWNDVIMKLIISLADKMSYNHLHIFAIFNSNIYVKKYLCICTIAY